jgi:hypothetical protein
VSKATTGSVIDLPGIPGPAPGDSTAPGRPAPKPPRPLQDFAAALELLPLEERFAELCRLSASSCVFQRMAAYRWLANMHRLDLRFETRAKRELRKGLDREQGLARARVRRLMKLC